jgi:hypothetical protein
MIQDNATQTGANSLQPAHAGRNAALAQIAAQVDASYQPDLASFDEETGQITPRQPPVQAQEQQSEQANDGQQGEEQTEGQGEEQTAQQQPAQTTEELETIVVDGQSVQVKRSQLFDAGKRTLQKEATADKRLQEATEMLRQAQAYAQSLRQQHQPSSDAGELSQSPSSDATNRSGATQATPSQDDIRALVRHEQWLANAETAAQRFRTEFKDIADDPLLMRLAGQLEDERLAQAAETGAPLGDPWEAYRKHGETIRARFGKPQGTQAAVSEDRQERKRSTTTVVGAGARMQASQPKQPLTTSEIIEQQRLARRQGRQHQPAR